MSRNKKSAKQKEKKQARNEARQNVVQQKPKKSSFILPVLASAVLGVGGIYAFLKVYEGPVFEVRPAVLPSQTFPQVNVPIAFIPNVIDPSAPLERRLVDVVENYLQKDLCEGVDYRFFDDSRTIQVFFPDKHKPDYQRLQVQRLRDLNSALARADVSVNGLGLEGFGLGECTPAVFARYRLARSDEQALYEDIARNYLAAGHSLSGVVPALRREGMSGDVANRAVNIILKGLQSISESFLFVKSISENAGSIPDAGAPGGAYLDCLPVVLFGLEDPSALEVADKVIGYAYAVGLKNVAGQCLALIESTCERCPAVTHHFDVVIAYMDSIVTEAEHYAQQNRGFLPPGSDPDTFSTEQSQQFSIMRRTGAWVNSIPDDINGVVFIVGGKAHTDYFRNFARDSSQSYLILPEFEINE